MQLNWHLHPKQINVQQARSAAYQYTLINYNDGRAELKVQHRGDQPSETPIKRFIYKNRNGAFGGAQRFEYKHGYGAADVDRLNRLCAMAWDEGYEAGYAADQNPRALDPTDRNPYRKSSNNEQTED